MRLLFLLSSLIISSLTAGTLHWEKVYNITSEEIFASPNCIECLDSMNCIALASEEGFIIIYNTSNGGKNWQKIYDDKENHYNQDTLDFTYKLRAYDAVWNNKDTILITTDYGLILKTTDMFKSFDTTKIQNNKYVLLQNIHMPNSKLGITGHQRWLWVTKDGWKTWTYIKNPDAPGIYNAKLFWIHNNNSFGYSWYDFYNNNYYSFTTDNGKNWNTQNLYELSNAEMELSNLFFVNDSLGFIVGGIQVENSENYNELILKTTNGGKLWEINYINQDTNWTGQLQSVKFRDQYNGIISGKNGKILRTSDGGINWIREFITQKSDDNIDTLKSGIIKTAVEFVGDRPLIALFDNGIWKGDKITSIHHTLSSHNNILTYPNPCHDFLYFQFPQELLGYYSTLQVFDINGNLITQEKLYIQRGRMKYIHEIQTSGTYFWQMEMGGEVYSGKFIIG